MLYWYESTNTDSSSAAATWASTERIDPKAKDKDIKKWKENLTLDLDKMEKEKTKQVQYLIH